MIHNCAQGEESLLVRKVALARSRKMTAALLPLIYNV